MKTNPKILTLVLTLAVLPGAAFADPTTTGTAQKFTTMATSNATASTEKTQNPVAEPVRFNLVDGEPVR